MPICSSADCQFSSGNFSSGVNAISAEEGGGEVSMAVSSNVTTVKLKQKGLSSKCPTVLSE